MASLGSLVVTLAANTAQFAQDLGRAAHQAAKSMEGIRKDAERAGKAITAMGAAAAAGAGLMVKHSIDAADAMHKLSQSAGIGIGTLSEFAYAAHLSGVNTQALAVALRALNRNISDASDGTGDAARAFQALGISVKDSSGNLKNSDQIMLEVAARFEKMEDGAGKSALAMMLFGKSGSDMIPMLNQGAKGLSEMREEAQALGLTLDSGTGKAAEAFNDNLSRLNGVKQGLANVVMRELLPSLNSLTEQLVESAKHSSALEQTARGAATGLRLLMSSGAIVAGAFKTLGEVLGSVAASLVAFAQGEYRRAWTIITQGGMDMAANIQGTIKTLETIWDETANSINAKAPDTAKKLAAPALLAADAARKSFEAMRDAIMVNYDNAMNQIRADNEIVKQWLDTVREASELYNKMRSGGMSVIEDDPMSMGGGVRGAEEAIARYKELREIRLQLMTDAQREEEEHEARLERLATFSDEELEALGGRNAIIEQMVQEHEDRIRAIRERSMTAAQKFTAMSYAKQAATIFEELAGITAGVAQHNRALFEINKIAAISSAIIKAHEGIALTMSKYPYPLNVAMAAAHGVAAFAQVNAIRAAQFQGGGGGAAPSLAGGTAATPVTPVEGGVPPAARQAPQRDVIVNMYGSRFNRDDVMDMLEGLNEAFGEGARLRVNMQP